VSSKKTEDNVDDLPRFPTRPQIAKALQVGENTIAIWCKNHDFPQPLLLGPQRSGLGRRVIRWDREEILAWLRGERRVGRKESRTYATE
jgi:predicted DNA-binding transcriptional regulator AlpA